MRSGMLEVLRQDYVRYPLVQGALLLIAVIYVLMNLLVDILYGVFDPRIKYE